MGKNKIISLGISPLAVSPSQAAAMCGISRTMLYEFLGKDIPVRKLGTRSLVLVSDIERFLNDLPLQPPK
jgi:hypothetical protein